jgi:glucose-6-phosphate dehydrogenase assembly protein OpcA
MYTVRTNMAPVAESYSLGIPVEVADIDSELKKLWADSADSMTRASLINLAVYSQDPDSLQQNTQLIAKITRDHACRALVIAANCDAQESRVQSWISAHCHVGGAGNKQICSEQLSFLLEGGCANLLPSIVFSHLDSDLPLYLWWQDEFQDPMDPQLWAWVDRLIYDSQMWEDFNTQLQLVETAEREANQRIILCDLNWTRLDKVRYAIAQFFDHPAAHHHFVEIEAATIDYGAGYRSTALFLGGWLGAQLGWRAEESKDPGKIRFVDEEGRGIEIALHENGREPINKVVLSSDGTEFVVEQAKCGDLLKVWREGKNEAPVPQMMPAQPNDPVSLMDQELMRGGLHRVYLNAINCVRHLR